MDGLEDCCCGPSVCQVSTSMGLAAMGCWKLGRFENPVAGQPHCSPYYRTCTATLTDIDGGFLAQAVATNAVQFGSIDPVPFRITVASPRIISFTGSNPCAVGGPTITALRNRTLTGYTADFDCSSVHFGQYDYVFSDPVSLPEVEASARMLAALVDWNALPIGSDLISYFDKTTGGITSQQHGIQGCGGDKANGFITGAGLSSWVQYSGYPQVTANRPTFADGTSIPWFTWPNPVNTGAWPLLIIAARAWIARQTIPGRWCRYTGSVIRDDGGLPGGCGISLNEATCGPRDGGFQNEVGGTFFELDNSVPLAFSFAGCGSIHSRCGA